MPYTCDMNNSTPNLIWVKCSKCGVEMRVADNSPLALKQVGHIINRGPGKGTRCEGHMEAK